MTRHPKSGKGRKWTVKELEAVSATWKGESLSDGDGLVGEVRVAGDASVSVHFRYGFKWETRKVWHYCGTWPATNLEAIRNERDRARRFVKDSIHPGDQRKAERIEAQAKVQATIAEAARVDAVSKPVRAMFVAWLADGVARVDGNAELRRSFEKDVLPAIGAMPVKDVSEHDIRALLRVMVKRGVHRMAVRTYNDIVQMFAWAEKRQPWRGLMVEGNPAELVEISKVLPPGSAIEKPRERILSADELRELRDIFRETRTTYEATPAGNRYSVTRPLKMETELAMWIALSTASRIGELLMARWSDVDLQSGEWFVPAANTKTGADWRVYLSDFAIARFRSLYNLTGDTQWCFPAKIKRVSASPANVSHICVKSASKQIGDRQSQFKNRSGPLKNRRNDNSLVLSSGARGDWTPHDLRRTAATMMQAMGITPEVIDACQNHVLYGSKVRRHYLHYDYADEKREAWQRLGERLESILS